MRGFLLILTFVLTLGWGIVHAQQPIPNNDTRALFLSLVAGRPFGQQTLLDIAGPLAAYCIQLTPPNAAGDRTKIGDPISHRWVRVGFGEGQWVWVVQSDVYQPGCTTTDQPVPTPPPVPPMDLTPILTRLTALEQQLQLVTANLGAAVTQAQQDARAVQSSLDALASVVEDDTNRIKTLEARPVPMGCQASLRGFPISLSCRLTP